MFSGWIKLHRQSLNTTALKDDARRGMWERILLRAAHTPTKVDWRGQTIVLAPGQCAISVRQFAAEGGQPYKAARGILDRFEREGMIQQMPILGAVKGAGRGAIGTLITVCNWERFQAREVRVGAERSAERGAIGAQQGRTEQEGGEAQEAKTEDSAWAGRQDRPSPNAASAPRDPSRDGAAPGADASGRRPSQDEQTTIKKLAAIMGPKSRKLASRLVKVCGVDHASAMLSQIEEAEDPRAYVAVTIKNAQLRADGRSGSGKPRPPDFAAVMDRICEAEFDEWERDPKSGWRPTEHSTYRTAEAAYAAWYEASVQDAVSQVGKENKPMIEQLFETLGLFEADHVMGEAYEKAHAGKINDQAAYVAKLLEKVRTTRN